MREKLWLCGMYPLSGLLRVGLALAPFRYWAPYLGREVSDRPFCPLATESQERLAWRIGRTCALAARYTPWETKCLAQAILTRTWLGRFRIPYVVHIGVKKAGPGAPDPFAAHAWVQVGRLVVCGRQGHAAFTVLSSYADKRLA